jgi:hypothetical protein
MEIKLPKFNHCVKQPTFSEKIKCHDFQHTWACGNNDEGVNAELTFRLMALLKNYTVKMASAKDNIVNHIDIWMTDGTDQKKIGVDVKSRKHFTQIEKKRTLSENGEELVWIELHGKSEKSKGWLFGGKANMYAFELMNGFYLVKNSDLTDYVNENVNFNTIVNDASQAILKVYQRDMSTHDRTTLIPIFQVEGTFWDFDILNASSPNKQYVGKNLYKNLETNETFYPFNDMIQHI